MSTNAVYPRVFITPEGRYVSVKVMAKALSAIKKNPEADYPGWNWYPTQGYEILREVRRGIHDRINRR